MRSFITGNIGEKSVRYNLTGGEFLCKIELFQKQVAPSLQTVKSYNEFCFKNFEISKPICKAISEKIAKKASD